MANLSKRTKYFSTIEDKKYSILEAVDLLKSSPKTNFNEAIDVAINLGIDTSKSDQTVRNAATDFLRIVRWY